MANPQVAKTQHARIEGFYENAEDSTTLGSQESLASSLRLDGGKHFKTSFETGVVKRHQHGSARVDSPDSNHVLKCFSIIEVIFAKFSDITCTPIN